MSAVTVYVPRDAAALSMGADKVATTILAEANKRGIEINLVRNGSRGMLWLEPLVEVSVEQGRVAYGPVHGIGRPRAVRCRVPRRQRPSAVPGPYRRNPLSEGAGAADLRPLRHRRSVVDRGLRSAWRQRGHQEGARRCPARISARPSPTAACAAVAARASRPASNGRPCSTVRPTKNSSPAMRTRATAVPLPTAC